MLGDSSGLGVEKEEGAREERKKDKERRFCTPVLNLHHMGPAGLGDGLKRVVRDPLVLERRELGLRCTLLVFLPDHLLNLEPKIAVVAVLVSLAVRFALAVGRGVGLKT